MSLTLSTDVTANRASLDLPIALAPGQVDEFRDAVDILREHLVLLQIQAFFHAMDAAWDPAMGSIRLQASKSHELGRLFIRFDSTQDGQGRPEFQERFFNAMEHCCEHFDRRWEAPINLALGEAKRAVRRDDLPGLLHEALEGLKPGASALVRAARAHADLPAGGPATRAPRL